MRACETCQWSGLPQRDVCPRCSCTTWRNVSERTGVVRAVTRVHRAFGHELSPTQVLALVELDVGGWIVGAGDLPEGATVTIGSDRVLRPR